MFGEIVSVEEFLLLFEEQQFFMYIAVSDDRTCKACMRLDKSLMTRREIMKRFKYLVKLNEWVWLPMTHPHCRCILLLWESDENKHAEITRGSP